jgi:hypothetical protein
MSNSCYAVLISAIWRSTVAFNEARFWSRFDKSTGCWLWTGAKSSNGKGVVSVNGRARLVHCVAYELTHGLIPSGMCVLLCCKEPLCGNPDELFLGTNLEAQQRTRQSRRGRPTPRPRTAAGASLKRLSDHQATAIRSAYAEGGVAMRTLAARYQVTVSAISKIVNGFSHAPSPTSRRILRPRQSFTDWLNS